LLISSRPRAALAAAHSPVPGLTPAILPGRGSRAQPCAPAARADLISLRNRAGGCGGALPRPRRRLPAEAPADLRPAGRGLRHQIPIASPSSGLGKLPSFTRPEDARALTYQRLDRRLGAVTPDELAAVRRILRAFLDL
jgi:hypothetical protein